MLIKIHFATGLLVLIVVIRAVGFSPCSVRNRWNDFASGLVRSTN